MADSPDIEQTRPETPVSLKPMRRSPLAWFTKENGSGDEFSAGTRKIDNSDQHRTSVERVKTSTSLGSLPSGEKKMIEWIVEWRDDMATVLKGFQEVQKREEDEDFRDLFAKMSVSTEGYSLSRSSGSSRHDSATGDVILWSVESSLVL